MAFTDEDLRRLQEEMGTVEKERWIRGETDVAPIESLLARLEAAEALIHADMTDAEHAMNLWDMWREAAGK